MLKSYETLCVDSLTSCMNFLMFQKNTANNKGQTSKWVPYFWDFKISEIPGEVVSNYIQHSIPVIFLGVQNIRDNSDMFYLFKISEMIVIYICLGVQIIINNRDMFWLFKILEMTVWCLGVQNIRDNGDMFWLFKIWKMTIMFKSSKY